jgi:hypothetical protein
MARSAALSIKIAMSGASDDRFSGDTAPRVKRARRAERDAADPGRRQESNVTSSTLQAFGNCTARAYT